MGAVEVRSFKLEYIPIAEKILKAYGLNVTIDILKYHGKDLSTSSVLVQGFIQQAEFDRNWFLIFITDDMRVGFKRLMIHEAAHIKQYVEGRLSIKNSVEYWDGKRIDFTQDYWDRPHEMDARKKVKEYKRKQRQLIIKKIKNKLSWQR